VTAAGTRRPREGRCERCDRPLTDLVWTTWTPITLCGPELPPITDWREETPTDDTRCLGEPLCSGVEVDWQARALAAEESVTVCKAMISQLVGDLDGMRDQYRRGYTNGHAAGRQAAYDGEEPKGYGQALRDMTARALAAEARLSVPATSADTTRLHRIRTRLLELVPADGTMSLWDDVQRLDRALADAESRGRAHGLLAAAWVCPECDCSDSWTLRGRHSTECAAWVRDEIAALADNGPPMAACADCDGFGGFSVYGKPSGTIVRPCETCDGEGWLAQEADRDG